MKINNIKFANQLKIMIYKLFLNNLQINDLEKLEKLFENKFLNENNIDEIKDKKIIKVNNNFISIRDLYINLGNNIVRYGKLKEFIKENEKNMKITKKNINKYYLILNENYKEQEKLFEKKIINTLFGLKENEKLKNCSLLSIEKIKENFKIIMEDFIKNYIDIIKYSNDIWTDITFKNLKKNELNIFTDTRFLTELEKINKINHQKLLIIKLKNNKIDGKDIKEEKLENFYQLYKISNSLEEFIKNIEKEQLVKNAEEMATALTFHFYIEKTNKFPINNKIKQDIKKLNIQVLWNNWGEIENLKNNSLKFLNNSLKKGYNNIILIANRKSGKDTILKFFKEYKLEEGLKYEY